MKKILFLLNAIIGILLVFGIYMMYSPEDIIPDTSDSSDYVGGALLTAFVLGLIIKPVIKYSWKEHEWNFILFDKKVRMLSEDLTSGTRYWAITKYVNGKYYFDPVLQDEMRDDHLSTDPIKLRNLLRVNQIENRELAEGILRELGYWDPAT